MTQLLDDISNRIAPRDTARPLLADKTRQTMQVSRSVVPAGVEPRAHAWLLAGPAAFGLSIALQLTIAAFVLWGPAGRAPAAGKLTIRGASLIHPEHDLPIYVGGIVLAVSLMGVATVVWRRAVCRMGADEAGRFAAVSSAVQGVLAAGSLIFFLCILGQRFPWDASHPRTPVLPLDVMALFIPATAAFVCCSRDLRRAYVPRSSLGIRATAPRRPSLARLTSLLFPLLIVLIVFIPPSRWNGLADGFYRDDLLHHWNFFAMGPAISYAHGGAFETDFYSQYGMGWPMLFAAIGRIVPLTYARMIGGGVVYGCIYYVGLYALLRAFFRDSRWAAVGTIMAVSWQLFTGQAAGEVMWSHPSSTLLRHPMDIWFFLALLRYQRTARHRWLAVAGAACGIGVFFETETGAYLIPAFACFLILSAGIAGAQRVTARDTGRNLIAFAFGGVLSALPLMAIASRGTLLRAAFWSGWLEGFRLQALSGLGFLPVAGLGDAALLLFVAFIGVYLLTIGFAAVRAAHGLTAPEDVFGACVAVYGLELLLIFVGRSHPHNLYHPSVPLAILVAVWLWRGFRAARRYVRGSAFPVIFAGSLLLLLLGSSDFMAYPNLLNPVWSAPRPQRPEQAPDPGDPYGSTRAMGSREFPAAMEEMRHLARDGSDVAVLDCEDTLFYHTSGVRPWSRYSSFFHIMFSRDQLEQQEAEFLKVRPKYVVMRSGGGGTMSDDRLNFNDVWESFHNLVAHDYHRFKTIGAFEFWERPEDAATNER